MVVISAKIASKGKDKQIFRRHSQQQQQHIFVAAWVFFGNLDDEAQKSFNAVLSCHI